MCRGGRSLAAALVLAAGLIGPASASADGRLLKEGFEPPSSSGVELGNFVSAITPPADPAVWAPVTTDKHSGTSSAFAGDPSHITDNTLTPPGVPIPPNAALTFFQRVASESAFDGGVLEASVDGGAFKDITDPSVAGSGAFVTGGYNGTISAASTSPIAGRQAWTGTIGGAGSFVPVTVNLSALAGHSVRLRWRFASDGSVSSTGWWVDDISLTFPADPVATINSSIAGTGQLQTGRLNRDGASSSCSAPNVATLANPTLVPYKTFEVSSLINEAACLSLAFDTATCDGSANSQQLILSAVYSSFNPADPTANEITAAGLSPNPAEDLGYRVSAAPGQSLTVDVDAHGFGATCPGFTGTITSDRPWATERSQVGRGGVDQAGKPIHAGAVLGAGPGIWTTTVTHAYRWQRCNASGAACVDIPGAVAPTFTPGDSLAGSTLRVVDAATDSLGTSSVSSTATGAVIARAPDTRLTKAKVNAKKAKATFKFKATGSSTGFECRLKRKHHKTKPFKSCASPKKYKHLKPGKYTFKVEAVGAGGTDASPAKKKFEI